MASDVPESYLSRQLTDTKGKKPWGCGFWEDPSCMDFPAIAGLKIERIAGAGKLFALNSILVLMYRISYTEAGGSRNWRARHVAIGWNLNEFTGNAERQIKAIPLSNKSFSWSHIAIPLNNFCSISDILCAPINPFPHHSNL